LHFTHTHTHTHTQSVTEEILNDEQDSPLFCILDEGKGSKTLKARGSDIKSQSVSNGDTKKRKRTFNLHDLSASRYTGLIWGDAQLFLRTLSEQLQEEEKEPPKGILCT